MHNASPADKGQHMTHLYHIWLTCRDGRSHLYCGEVIAANETEPLAIADRIGACPVGAHYSAAATDTDTDD